MKIINSPFEIAQKLIKLPKRIASVSYHPAHYSFSIACEDGMLLYHTLTGELILRENDDDCEDFMIEHGFLVPQDYNEQKMADQLRSVASMLAKKNEKTSFLIYTTTDCNARCFYCFEQGCKRVKMTVETAKSTADYMIRVSGDKILKLTWFGGEPLYNIEAIRMICSELSAAGKSFRSAMVSNGYYLNADIAKEAHENWNLSLVQITLDGTKEVYQRTKAYIERDENAYERVINNIRSAAEAGISVLIRFNMDQNNAQDLFLLADELKDKLAGLSNITGQCELLHEYTGKIGLFSSETEAAETWQKLQEKLDKQWPGRKMNLPRSPIVCVFYPQCIILKRCNSADRGCTESVKRRKCWETEQKILAAYRQYKKENER